MASATATALSGVSSAARWISGRRVKTPSYGKPIRTIASGGGASARKFRPAAAAADDAESPPTEELIQSGAVISAHGLKGEVRVMPFTDFVEERFFSPCTQYIEDQAQGRTAEGDYDKPPGTVSKVRIIAGREVTSKGRNECVIKIKGVNDRNASEALIGRRLYVLASDRPELREEQVGSGDDEFYSSELEGLEVVMQETGAHVGKVVDVFRGAGTHDLLKVNVPPLPTPEGEEPPKFQPEEHVFVPFVKDIVPSVDLTKGVLEITPPPGLLDLRQKAQKPKRQRARGPPPPKKKQD
jgi:16S rRNA processing protein RimM